MFVNLNKSNFSTITILYPKDEVIQAFDELATPFHDAILSNEKQSLTLRRHARYALASLAVRRSAG